ncbi:MAG: hypothetical protein AAB721_02780 [Patescibacteria group bacterium]
MAFLKFDEALQLKGRKFEVLEVPELGGSLKLGALPAGKALEFKELHAKVQKAGGSDPALERKQMVVLLTAGVVNEDESPFFADEKAALRFIEKVSFESLQLIMVKLTDMLKAAAKKDETPEGNSEGSSSGG